MTKGEKKIEQEKARVREDLMKLTKAQIIDQLMQTVDVYAAERAAHEGVIREQERRIETHTENWSSLRNELDRVRTDAETRGRTFEAERRRLEAALEEAHCDLEQKGRDFELLATGFEALNRHYTERG